MIDYQSLAELRSLSEGWDGYNGAPISDKALRTAEFTKVTPMSNGGVLVELHTASHSVEIDIDTDGEVALVTVSPREDKK